MINDGIGNGNFTTLKPFAFWTQHVLPLVYGDEISYMETLDKMRYILNELIKNNNNLPEYIQQMIEEYISSGAIEEVIDKILSNFILNVKYPPTGVPKAKGDGTTNDHDSIQGCIDYAAGLGGGVVYLPAGKYLTSSLVLKPGVTLLGFGRYATSLNLAGGATTHLITGTVNDAGLVNLTLNAKMSSQVNRANAVELIGHHIEIRNVVAKDCYTSINIQKNGTAITISNVLCETASDACLRVGGTDGGLLVDGLEMTGLSTNLGVAYLVTDSNGDIYRNINIHGTGALGIDVAGSQNYFDGKISGVTKDYEDLSGDNTFELFGKSSVKNYTNDVVENANAFSQVAVNGIERQGANIGDNATNAYTVNAKDVVLNPTNPVTYKEPVVLNKYFNYVNFKDNSNNPYKVLVGNAYTENLGASPIYNVKEFGAIGNGVADDYQAFLSALNEAKATSGKILIPTGNYFLSQYIVTQDKYIYDNLGTYVKGSVIYSSKLKDSNYGSRFIWKIRYTDIETYSANINRNYQSGVYVPDTDSIWLGFSENITEGTGDGKATILEVSKDFKTFKRTATDARLGHISDMTYNPKTKTVFVAPYKGDGLVYEVSPATMTIVNTHTITGMTGVKPVGDIEYIPKYNCYFAEDLNRISILDENFVAFHNFMIHNNDGGPIPGFEPYLRPLGYGGQQGSTSIDGNFLLDIWISAQHYTAGTGLFNPDLIEPEMKNYFFYQNNNIYEESEAAFVMNGKMYLIGTSTDGSEAGLYVRECYLTPNEDFVKPVNLCRANDVSQNVWVDETLANTGDGTSPATAFNDLQLAFDYIDNTKECNLFILNNTVKTTPATLYNFNNKVMFINANNKVINRPIVLYNSRNIYLQKANVTGQGSNKGIQLRYGSTLETDSTVTFTNCAIGVSAENNCQARIAGSAFNGCTACVSCQGNGEIYLQGTGSGNTNLVSIYSGGICIIGTARPAATNVSKSDSDGGLVVDGFTTVPAPTPGV